MLDAIWKTDFCLLFSEFDRVNVSGIFAVITAVYFDIGVWSRELFIRLLAYVLSR
jgi:hypothetical protein